MGLRCRCCGSDRAHVVAPEAVADRRFPGDMLCVDCAKALRTVGHLGKWRYLGGRVWRSQDDEAPGW